MFTLCKTVKIYHTVNQPHSSQGPKDPNELHFQDCPPQEPVPLPGSPLIRMVESHSVSPKKTKTGINLSLRHSQASPSKYSQRTHSQDISHSIHKRSSTNCPDPQSELSSSKVKNFRKFIRETPRIVESKITIEKMSPRQDRKSSHQQLLVNSQVHPLVLSEIPLKKQSSGASQKSLNSNQPNIMVHAPSNPLKRSTTFLRSSSRRGDSLRQSLENSLSNTIDFKFSNYKLKRQDASDSLLRLSCSSYSQILDKNNQGLSDFSQSCSLELKREEDCYLKEYVCEVEESLILDKEQTEKYIHIVKSNKDLLNRGSNTDDNKNKSNILEGESPLKKMKKRYGENMLHPFDKQTIESKSFISKSRDHSFRQIIDESYVIEHDIEEQFEPLRGREVVRADYRLFLAVQKTAGLLLSIKEMSARSLNQVNKELNIYKDIENTNVEAHIIRLHQMYTQNSKFILVKEPYETTLPEFIYTQSHNYGQIGWQFLARRIQETVSQVIDLMSRQHMYLSRPITTQDLVQVFDDWKLHSPDMFTARLNIRSLREEITSRSGSASRCQSTF